MNDHPAHLTDYDTFSEDAREKLTEIGTLATSKLYQERVTLTKMLDLPGWFPWIGNDHDYGDDEKADFDGTTERFWDYCSDHLSADYDGLEKMASSMSVAKVLLNGMQAPEGVPDASDIPGIDASLRKISEGLSTWDNDTADTFKEKYVDTIGAVKTNQFTSVDRSLAGIRTAQDILVESRNSARELLKGTLKALNDYNPTKDEFLGIANITLNTVAITVGVAATPAAGAAVSALVAVGTSYLPPETGLSVVGIMKKLRDAVDTNETDKGEVEAEATSKMGDYTDQEWKNWKDHVCARPGEP